MHSELMENIEYVACDKWNNVDQWCMQNKLCLYIACNGFIEACVLSVEDVY